MLSRFLFRGLPPVLLLLLTGGLLELSVRLGWVESFLVPAPTEVGAAFVEFAPELAVAIRGTAVATLGGLLISLLAGQTLAFALTLFPMGRRAVYPFAVFFQTVPIIAIAPLLVIWFGFGAPTVTASAAIVSFFPILSNAMSGLDSVRREHLELFQVYGAGRLPILLKLQAPSGLRASFAGLRIAAGLAVVGALVGEFVGGGGLGALIDSGRTQQRVDLVFACVILSAVLGLVLIGIVLVLEFFVQRWRPFDES